MTQSFEANLRRDNPDIDIGDEVCVGGIMGTVLEIFEHRVLIRCYDGAKILVHRDFIMVMGEE